MNLNICRSVILDEADRLHEDGFREEIMVIFSFFRFARQTALFSATISPYIEVWSKKGLVRPVFIKVMRRNLHSSNVKQQLIYVKKEDRDNFLVNCLSNTRPPVLIFAENSKNCTHLYSLLVKRGLNVTLLHSLLDQKERDGSVADFKSGRCDILIATDVASKGLDFRRISHVINYDLPDSLDDYIHRVGRTGRGDRYGLATTVLNKDCKEHMVSELVRFFKREAMKIPFVLESLFEGEKKRTENYDNVCPYCGMLGHAYVNCRKAILEAVRYVRRNNDSMISSRIE